MQFKRFLLVLMLSLGVATCAFAQAKPSPTPVQPKPGPTATPDKDEVIKVDTQLVDVPIAVVSPNGTPVRGLKATNFAIYEDGQKQEVVDFAATTAPFEVALLLDTSGSTRGDLQLIQRSAIDFISSLRPGDRVAIISYDTQRSQDRAFAVSQVLVPLTDDRKKLFDTVQRMRTSNGTPYYDSLLDVAEKVFKEKPQEEFRGRRALVALTDGVDSTSGSEFVMAKEELEQAGVVSFFIKVDTRDFFESNLLGDCEVAMRFSIAQIRRYYRSIAGKPGMEKTFNFCQLGDFERLAISKRLYEIADLEMNDLAKASGGKVFPVEDLTEARNAFRSVADEIGTKYTLGYYSSNTKRDGTYRKIRVELVGMPKGTLVRSREGYNAPTR